MSTSPTMSRSAIALPSIREMFPDMDGSAERSTLQPIAPHHSPQQAFSSSAMRSTTDAAISRNADKHHTHARYATSPYPRCGGPLPSPPPSRSGEPPIHGHSSSEVHHRHPRPPSPAYSFAVLRTDPAGSSLEHVASSTSSRSHPRATHLAPVVQPTHTMAHTSGVAPVFRVSMPIDMDTARRYQYHDPAAASNQSQTSMTGQVTFREGGEPSSSKHHHYSSVPLAPSHAQGTMVAHTQQQQRHAYDAPSSASPAGASIPPGAMLAFSITDPPGRAPTIVDGSRRGFPKIIEHGSVGQHAGGSSGEGRGKRHECPHCRKRFNRPSSLKIHVNTHTGARPYRCPYPGCGREFNVNSNMRRHWRNHSRVGAGPFPEELVDVFVQTHRPDPRSAGHPASGPAATAVAAHRRAASGASSNGVLMSPPTTAHSVSDGDSDEEHGMRGGPMSMSASVPARRPYSAMDVDDDPSSGESPSDDDDEEEEEARPRKIPARPIVPSSSSSESDWSRPASPYRQSTAYYTHAHHPRNGYRGEYTYRPSLPAYVRAITDTRVSTALRPAFAT